MNNEPIGLIGIGLLGVEIAKRLLDGGFSVVGFDVADDRRNLLKSMGGDAVDEPADVLRKCNEIVFSLPTSDIVATIINQLTSEWRTDQVVIDTTTGDPTEMIKTSARLRSHGTTYIEATVAGSSQQLRQGEASLFLGDNPEALAQVENILAAISPKRFSLGDVGAASKFKLVHNLFLGLHRAVLAEGLTFAEQLGFDPLKTLNTLQQTPAASSVMQTKGERMINRDFAPQARLSQHLKDVRLILSEADRADAKVPLSELHSKLLEQVEQLGHGESDNSAIIESFRSD